MKLTKEEMLAVIDIWRGDYRRIKMQSCVVNWSSGTTSWNRVMTTPSLEWLLKRLASQKWIWWIDDVPIRMFLKGVSQ